MEKLVFVTNNLHKLQEIRKMLSDKIDILSLADLACHDEIEETADTLEGNALIKARYVYDKYQISCFADDSGLLVDALNGEPGVYSARYSGKDHDSFKNISKLLSKLNGIEEERRTARFQTVIAFIDSKGEHLFNGEILGKITTECRGEGGFGYDSVFVPDGYSKTFAEMTFEDKNKISHRAKAVNKFITYIKTNIS